MSRLMIDHSAGAYAVRVSCAACRERVQMSETVIDKDGPPFDAYYCRACVDTLWPNALVRIRCSRDGCPRCPSNGANETKGE